MKNAGLMILLIVLIGTAAIVAVNKGKSGANHSTDAPNAKGEAVTVSGDVGGEKIEFLKDPSIVRILKDKYALTVNATQRGSVEMVADPSENRDFIWPAGEIETYRGKKVAVQPIFNSPIVFYSWKPVADALIANGIVKQENGAYYVVDLPKFIALLEKDAKWSEIGLPDLFGSVRLTPTDPSKSNSGLMFAGLYANMLNGGKVVTLEKLDPILKKVKAFFDNLGLLEGSSGTLFEKYLGQGVGQFPIIVGYENQLVEFALANPSLVDPQAAQLRVLYPKPTVWASHPFIAVNEKGKRLMDALMDEKIQELAWERHGFRSIHGRLDTRVVKGVGGIPKEIASVIPLPVPDVMRRLSAITRPQ